MPGGIKDSNSPRQRIIKARETAATEAARNLSLERKKAASERAKRIASWEAKNKNISKKKTSSPKLFKTLKSKKGLLAGLNALPVGQEEAAPLLGRSASSSSSLVSEPALFEEETSVSPTVTASPRLASPTLASPTLAQLNRPNSIPSVRGSPSARGSRSPRGSRSARRSRSPRGSRSPRRSRSRSPSPVLRRNSSVNSLLAAARARIAEVSAQREAIALEAQAVEEARVAQEASRAEARALREYLNESETDADGPQLGLVEEARLEAARREEAGYLAAQELRSQLQNLAQDDDHARSHRSSSSNSSRSVMSNRTDPPSPTSSERYWARLAEEDAARAAARELRDPWHHPYERPRSLNIPADPVDPNLPRYNDFVPPDYDDIESLEAYDRRIKKRKDKSWKRRHPFLNLIGKKRKGSPVDPLPEYYPPQIRPQPPGYTAELPPLHRTYFVPPQGGKRMKKTRKNRKYTRKYLTRRRRN